MTQYGIANRAVPSLPTAGVPAEMEPWTKAVDRWASSLPLASIECKVSKSAAWSTNITGLFTKVVFDGVNIDTGNFVGDLTAAVTSDRIIIPPQAGGHYLVCSSVFDDAAHGGPFHIAIFHTNLKGVSTPIAIDTWAGPPQYYDSLSGHVYAKPGEYITLEYSNGSGVAVTIPVDFPWFLSIARVAL